MHLLSSSVDKCSFKLALEKNPCCAPLFLLLVDALCADGFIISFFLSFLVGLLLSVPCFPLPFSQPRNPNKHVLEPWLLRML